MVLARHSICELHPVIQYLKDYRHLFYWHRISTTLRHLFCRMWMNPQEHGITCASHTSWQRSGCFLFKTPREDVMTRMGASCMFPMTTYSPVMTTKHHLSQRFTITVHMNMIKYQSWQVDVGSSGFQQSLSTIMMQAPSSPYVHSDMNHVDCGEDMVNGLGASSV